MSKPGKDPIADNNSFNDDDWNITRFSLLRDHKALGPCHLKEMTDDRVMHLVHVAFDNNHKLETRFRSCVSSSCRLFSRSEEAVKGGANCFVVRGVHRSAAETLDGLCSGGYERL